MRIVNESELLQYWLWSQMQIESLENLSPDWLAKRVQTFNKLTLYGRGNLLSEMDRSDWNL